MKYKQAIKYAELLERDEVLEPEELPELRNIECTSDKKCRKCDADVYSIMNFCYHCGQRLKKEKTYDRPSTRQIKK
jgi:predicted amidophosphoribosyltransferase